MNLLIIRLCVVFSLLEAILEIIGKIGAEVFKLFWNRWSGQALRQAPTKPYQARFAKSNLVLSRFGKGFCLTGTQNLSVDSSFRNSLVVGGTGTGKSSVALIPSILTMCDRTCSFVIHDPSGELLTTTGKYLAKQGYEVKVLRYDRHDMSAGYNPLARIRYDHDITLVAHTLITSGLGNESSKDSFWENQGERLLSFLIRLVLHQDREYRHLPQVLRYLNHLQAHPQVIRELVTRTKNESLKLELDTFLNMEGKILNGVIATVQASLKYIGDSGIQRIMSHDTIELEMLRYRPTAIFIQNPIMTQKAFAPITSIFFTQLFEALITRLPEAHELNVFLLIDEASSFKVSWPLYLANVRKYRVGVLLALQSIETLKEQFSQHEAETILANSYTKLYFTNPPLNTALKLSQTLGTCLIADENGFAERRPLMTPQEIMQMPAHHGLLFAGNHPGMLVELKPYYRSKLRRWIRRVNKA